MTTAATTKAYELLGADADALLSYQAKGFNKTISTCPGRISSIASCRRSDRSPRCCGTSSRSSTHGRLAGTGYVSILPVDQGIEHSAGASFAPNSDVLRPGEHREAGDRRRLQRVASTLGVLWRGRAQVRPQDPVPREAQPQRVPDLSEQVRPDHVRQRQAGVRHGRGRRRRDDLLRLGRIDAADPGSVGRPSRRPTSWAWSPCCGATCATAPSRRPTRTTTRRRPDRPGESSRRDDPGRHHQAEAAGEQRRLQRASKSSARLDKQVYTRARRPAITRSS